MKIKTFEFNPMGVNTYVLSDETKECVVIDATCFYTDEKELLLHYILDNDLVVKQLINTHLHFDHIFGVNMLTTQFGVSFAAHRADEFLLENIQDQLQLFGMPRTNTDYKPVIDRYLEDGDVIDFGNQQLVVIHVPGHSPGSVVFYNVAEGVLFSGDVLFHSSIGRTDLVGGNHETLIAGIKNKLLCLPPETKVYPGHGPITTIGQEKKNNPFVGIG